MTSDAKVTAALAARQEDQQLTEIAQIAPGNTARAAAMMVNYNVAPALLAVFEAASNSAHYLKLMETFVLQQQDEIVLQQQGTEKKDKERREEAWLEAMSPEYKQAYGELMATIKDADKSYNSDRDLLQRHRKVLDEEATDIDDEALHLSDGSRAYRDDNGNLVDKRCEHLQGQKAIEAATLAQQRGGNVAHFTDYRRNQDAITRTDTLIQKIDADQTKAHQYGKDATNPKKPDAAEVRAHNQEIKRDEAADTAAAKAVMSQDRRQVTQSNEVSMADLSDDAVTPTAAAPGHGSFASQVNPAAGIQANGLTAPFNAATQGPVPAAAVAVPAQRPAVGPTPS